MPSALVADAEISDDLAAELAAGDVVSLSDIGREQAVDPSAVFRWMQRGLPDGAGGRVFLQAIRRGRKWITSSKAVARFFARLKQANPSAPMPTRTPTQRERDTAKAQRQLQERFGV